VQRAPSPRPVSPARGPAEEARKRTWSSAGHPGVDRILPTVSASERAGPPGAALPSKAEAASVQRNWRRPPGKRKGPRSKLGQGHQGPRSLAGDFPGGPGVKRVSFRDRFSRPGGEASGGPAATAWAFKHHPANEVSTEFPRDLSAPVAGPVVGMAQARAWAAIVKRPRAPGRRPPRLIHQAGPGIWWKQTRQSALGGINRAAARPHPTTKIAFLSPFLSPARARLDAPERPLVRGRPSPRRTEKGGHIPNPRAPAQPAAGSARPRLARRRPVTTKRPGVRGWEGIGAPAREKRFPLDRKNDSAWGGGRIPKRMRGAIW